MIAVLALIFALLQASMSAPCPQMCLCAGGQCEQCYKGFDIDANIEYYPDSCGCPEGYYQNANSVCAFCPIQCLTCTSETTCLTCEKGFQVVSGKCLRLNNNVDIIPFQNDLDKQKFGKRIIENIWLIDSVLTNDFDNYFGQCDELGQDILGKYYFDHNTIFIKTYYGIPHHQFVDLKLQIVIIDQWANEGFTVEIQRVENSDKRTIIENPPPYRKQIVFDEHRKIFSNFCGQNKYDDALATYRFSISHTSSIFKIRLGSTSTLNNEPFQDHYNNMYYGIKEIMLTIGNCPKGCVTCTTEGCFPGCLINYKYDSTNYACICDTAVAILTSSGDCIDKCKATEIFNDILRKCIPCMQYIYGCETCVATSCSKCVLGYFLLNGKCVKKCPFGYEEEKSNDVYFCEECGESCAVCKQDVCLQCKQGYLLYQGVCAENCPPKTYSNWQETNCMNCPENCDKCTQFYCTQCDQDNSAVSFELIAGQCIEICTVTNQPMDYTGCPQACATNCLECFGANDNQCYSCSQNFVLQDYSCLSSCNSGYFEYEGICYRCSDKCSQCTHIDCSACTNGFWLHESQCINKCPLKYFERLSDNSCQPCGANCNICFDENTCQICHDSWYLINGVCQQTINCPIQTYYNQQLRLCMNCPQWCEKCFLDLCQKCQTGRFLNNGKCVSECPSEKYTDHTNQICKWKDPLCDEFDQDNQICLKCKLISPPLILSNDQKHCLFSCPDGYTKTFNPDNSQTACDQTCPASCLQCTLNQACHKCQSGLLIMPDYSDPCVEQCPDGYRSDSIQCIVCPSGCKRCQYNGQCLECFDSYEGRTLYLNEGNCVEEDCSYGFKSVAITGTCVSCDISCKTCTQVPQKCTSCPETTFLIDGDCSSYCPYSYFTDQISGLCQKCPPTCNKCINFHTCTQCQTGFYFFGERCVSQCPSGYFLYENSQQDLKCTKCSQNCETCYGKSEYQCISCYEGYYLDVNNCVEKCPKGKYVDKFGHCDSCSYLCQYCFGPASFQCIDCVESVYFYDHICYEACPTKTYYNTVSEKCEKCLYGCQDCNQATSCNFCQIGFYLSNGECIQSCPDSTYADQNNECIACELSSSNCKHCTSAGCTVCENPYFRDNKQCVLDCPLGTYKAFHNLRQCLNCPHHCLECTSPTSCKKCKKNRKLSKGICLYQCQINNYFDALNDQCRPCSNIHCETCLSPNQCIKCIYGTFLLDNICKENCPNNYYSSLQTGKCLSCHSACNICQSEINCMQCKAGYKLIDGLCINYVQPPQCETGCALCSDEGICLVCMTPYYLTPSYVCALECQEGYYSHLRSCYSCPTGCNTCEKQKCLTCHNGLALFDDSCKNTCPIGYYKQIDTLGSGSCEFCNRNCIMCDNFETCVYCNSGYVLFEGTCLINCPNSFYRLNGECIECEQNCLECYSAEQCLKCSVQSLLIDGKCLQNYLCPLRTYLSDINTCVPCQLPCKTCIDEFTCQSCQSGYSLHGLKCLQKCPSSHYSMIQDNEMKCQPCSTQCLTCMTNSITCTSCLEGFYLSGQKCVVECPISTYGDQASRTCRKCSPYCIVCESNIKCSYCHSFMFLLNGQCVLECPDSYSQSMIETQVNIYNKMVSVCQLCSKPCLTCSSDSIYKCKSCVSGYYLNGERCLENCEPGYYKDQSNKVCRFCAPNCATCSQFDDCLTCNYGTDAYGICLPENPCPTSGCPTCGQGCRQCYMGICHQCYSSYFLFEGACLTSCNSNQYVDQYGSCVQIDVPQTCLYKYNDKCYSECPQFTKLSSDGITCELDPCLSYSNSLCISCMSPYLFYQSECITDCPSNYYKTATSCEKCPQNCLECTSYKNCEQCVSGYHNYEGICLINCPIGYYADSLICQKCNSTCLQCNDAQKCTKCPEGLYLHENVCYLTCPNGKYQSDFKRSCQVCDINCHQCLNNTHCEFCNPGLFQHQGKCLSQCQKSYYAQLINTFVNSATFILGKCQPCEKGCVSCLSASECISCNSEYFLRNSDCVLSCPSSTYQFYDGVLKECKNCEQPCATCVSSTKCISCVIGYSLFNNLCLASCPPGYYSIDLVCKQCSPLCQTCSSQYSCTTCYSGYALVSGKCVSKCTSPNQYYDEFNQICRSCSSQCLECYGPRYDECISCSYPLKLVDGICVVSCPSNYIWIQTEQQCKQCEASCEQCIIETTGIQCNDCLNGYYLLEGNCLKQCPDGYYEDQISEECKLCSTFLPECDYCEVNTLTGIPYCTKCKTGKIFNLKKQCILPQKCPQHTMIILQETCMFCSDNCVKCIENSEQEKCVECISGYVLSQNGNCIADCHNFQTLVLKTNIHLKDVPVCYPCSTNCISCTDASTDGLNLATQCQVCVSPYYLHATNNQCVVSCPEPLIPAQIPKRQCVTAIYKIDECSNSNYLILTDTLQCVEICPEGYYQHLNTDNKEVCTKCKVGCATCIDEAICLTCQSTFLMLNGNDCVSQCPLTHLQINNKCYKCQSPCLSCIDTLSYCATCQTTKYWFSGQCLDSCPDGNYASEMICMQCPLKCSTCTTNGVCISCTNQFYSAPDCVDTSNYCNSIQYQAGVTSCNNCHSSCLTCFGSTQSNCLSCPTTYSFIQSQCLIDCPNGYTKTTYTTPVQCLSCSEYIANCKVCSQIDVNTIQCTQCIEPYFIANQKCVKSCSQINTGSTIYSLLNSECVACIIDCAQCYQGECLECVSPKYLETMSDGSKRCVDSCSTGYYTITSTTSQCYPCDSSCKTCTLATVCQTCISGSYLYLGQCVASCPPGTLVDYTQTFCLKCSSYLGIHCNECENTGTISDIPKCTNCVEPFKVDLNGNCIECLDGYYYLSSSLSCEKCNFACSSCSSKAQCTSCISGYLLINSQCIASCPIGTYQNSNTCTDCSQQYCLKCDSSNCLECKAGYGLHSNSCQSQCPATTFMQNKICKSCEANCKICTSQQKCTQCIETFHFLFQEDCLISCPKGYAPNGNQCTKCKTGCLQCPTDVLVCGQCQNGLTNNNDGTCSYIPPADPCPSGQYKKDNQCYPCSSSCAECISGGYSDCTQCKAGFTLSTSGTCISICSATEYYSTGSTCESCSNNCFSCINTATQCRSCPSGKFLTSSKTCSDSCSPGTYMSNSICYNCPEYCHTCTSSLKCSSCKAEATIMYNNMCYVECPQQSYADSAASCAPCSDSCRSCTSGTKCEKCFYQYILYQNKETSESVCLSECPKGSYQISESCIQCPDKCQQCNETSCLKCSNGNYLINDTCSSECPVKMFGNSQGQCQNCPEECSSCSSLTSCRDCREGYFLFQFSCVSTCPQSYKPVGKKCIKVECQNCEVCVSAKCQQCNPNFFLHQGECYDECIQRYYEDNSTQKCEPCIQNCLQCENSTCSLCFQGYAFTEQTGCVTQAFLEYGILSNISGFTSNITEVTSMVYLSTSAGPMVFGEMATTYFNVEFCQFLFFHEGATEDNEELKTFLQSLSFMSFSSGISSLEGRRLLFTKQSLNFVETNIPIFAIMGSFLALYLIIYIIQKNIQNCCLSCPNANFYTKEICIYLRKRFKWIYFDFVMWISYLPFLYFGLAQIQKFNFNSGIEGFSSILSIAIIAVYPLYPIFICYHIKKNYEDICKQTNTLVEMSLSPWLAKVKRPEVMLVGDQFRYFTVANFKLIYYPLKYFRKFIFVLVVIFCPIPVATLGILIGLNIVFICYMAVFRPRIMPYMVFDFIIEGILLGFEIFLLVYVTYGISDVNAMSIIAHGVGFITANLSIIIAIILNLVAYYHIIMCLYHLVKHLQEKMEEKQKNELRDDSSKLSEGLHPNDLIMLEKEKIDIDIKTQDLSDDERQIAKDLDDKDLVINKIQPRYNITKEQYKNLFGDKQMIEEFKKKDDDQISQGDIKTENLSEQQRNIAHYLDDKDLVINRIQPRYDITKEQYKNLFGDKELEKYRNKDDDEISQGDIKTQNLSEQQRNIAHFLDDKDLIINGIQPKYHNINFQNQRDLFGDKQIDNYYRDHNRQQGNIFNDKDLGLNNYRPDFGDDDFNIHESQGNQRNLFDDKELFQNTGKVKRKNSSDDDQELPSIKQKKNKKKKKKNGKDSRKNLMDNASQMSEQLMFDSSEKKEKLRKGAMIPQLTNQKKVETSRQNNLSELDEVYHIEKNKRYSPNTKRQKLEEIHGQQRNSHQKDIQEGKFRQRSQNSSNLYSEEESSHNLLTNKNRDVNIIEREGMKKRKNNQDQFDDFLQDGQLTDRTKKQIKKNEESYRYKNNEKSRQGEDKQTDSANFYNRNSRNKRSFKNIKDQQINSVGVYERQGMLKNKEKDSNDQTQPTNLRVYEREGRVNKQSRSQGQEIEEGRYLQKVPKKITKNYLGDGNNDQYQFEEGKLKERNIVKRGQDQSQELSYYERKKKKTNEDDNKQLQQGQFSERTKNKRSKQGEPNIYEGIFSARNPSSKKKLQENYNQKSKVVNEAHFEDRQGKKLFRQSHKPNDDEEIDEGLLVSRKPKVLQRSPVHIKNQRQQERQIQEAAMREREKARKQKEELRFTRGRAADVGEIDEGLMKSVNPKLREQEKKAKLQAQNSHTIYEEAEELEDLKTKQRQKKQKGFFSKLFNLNESEEEEEVEEIKKQKNKNRGIEENQFQESEYGRKGKQQKVKRGKGSMMVRKPEDKFIEEDSIYRPKRDSKQSKKDSSFGMNKIEFDEDDNQIDDSSPDRLSVAQNKTRKVEDHGLNIQQSSQFEDQQIPRRMRRSKLDSNKSRKGKLNLNEDSDEFNEEQSFERKEKESGNVVKRRKPANSKLVIQKRQDNGQEDLESIQL